jgi:hypothetical protein
MASEAESFLTEPPSNERMDRWEDVIVRTGERNMVTVTGTRGAAGVAAPIVADLGQWVAPETLVNLALSVAQNVDEARLRPCRAEGSAASLPGRMMLALVVCSYAKGIYRSQSIAEKAHEDPAIGYLCGSLPPDGPAIRRFRNRNREIIAQCLETVCLAVWMIRFGRWRSGLPAGGRRSTSPLRRWDPLTHIEMKCEAMERMQRAEVEDNWGLAEAVFAA